MIKNLRTPLKVLKLARIVRKAADTLIESGNYGNSDGGGDLAGACGDVALVMTDVLNHAGISATFEAGEFDEEGHCWTRLGDGTILDLTATQFSKCFPKIYHSRDRGYVCEKTGVNARRSLSDWADPSWRYDLRAMVKKLAKKAGQR